VDLRPRLAEYDGRVISECQYSCLGNVAWQRVSQPQVPALFLGPCFERMAPKAVNGDDAVEVDQLHESLKFHG
jgi:hypothetical protein